MGDEIGAAITAFTELAIERKEPDTKIIEVYICKIRKKSVTPTAGTTSSRPSGGAAMY